MREVRSAKEVREPASQPERRQDCEDSNDDDRGLKRRSDANATRKRDPAGSMLGVVYSIVASSAIRLRAEGGGDGYKGCGDHTVGLGIVCCSESWFAGVTACRGIWSVRHLEKCSTLRLRPWLNLLSLLSLLDLLHLLDLLRSLR